MLHTPPPFDVLAFSPYRWAEPPHRPQQLMTDFSSHRRVFFVEAPLLEEFERPFLKVSQKSQNLQTATPCLPKGLSPREQAWETRILLAEWIRQEDIVSFTSWYFTSSALRYSRGLEPEVVVYHRLDEPEANEELQAELLEIAQLVFTELHLQDVDRDEEFLQREQQVRETLQVPPMAFLNSRKRGTLIAPLR